MKRTQTILLIVAAFACLAWGPAASAEDAQTKAEKAWAKYVKERAKDLEKAAEEAAKLAEEDREKQLKEAAKLAEDEAKFYAKRYKDRGKGKGPWGGKHGGAGATHVPIVDEDLEFTVALTQDQIQATEAHAHARGRGVTVAVLDGGFDLQHPAIAGNLHPFGYDAVDDDWDPEDLGNGFDDDFSGACDDGVGHGTFVAGMVLLAAPKARILPIRVRDDEGWGYNGELERGLEYAWAAGADVVNISGGAPEHDYKKVHELLELMRADGIVVIVASGNDGLDVLPAMPARHDTIAVGAVDSEDRVAPFSNVGQAPGGMLLAPGVDLYGPVGAQTNGDHGYGSGTSFSAGLVSGAAALVLEVFPEFTPQDVYARLEATCDPAWDRYGALMPTGGRINLYRAVTP